MINLDPSTATIVGSHLSATSTTITATGLLLNETSYMYWDYGASHFANNYFVNGEFNISAVSGAADCEVSMAFANSLGSLDTLTTGVSWLQFNRSGSTITAYIGDDSGYATGTFNYQLNTTYYYKFGVSSGVGHYGAVILEVYSDSAKTNLIEVLIQLRGAATNYRYLLPALSYNSATADSISYTNTNLKLDFSGAGMNLTSSFTETDTPNYQTVYANSDVVAGYKQSSSTASKLSHNYGYGYFSGDWQSTASLLIASEANGSALDNLCGVLSLSGASIGYLDSGYGVGVIVQYLTTSGGKKYYSVAPYEVSATTPIQWYVGTQITIVENQLIFLKFIKDTSVGSYGAATLYAFHDSGMTELIGTSNVLLHASQTSTYFTPLINAHLVNSSLTSNFYIGNVSISLGIPVSGTIGFTLAGITAALTGSSFLPVSGTIGCTLSGATYSLTANVPLFALINITLSGITASVTGHSNVPVSALINSALSGVAVSISGINAAGGTSVTESFSVMVRDKETGVPITGLSTVQLKVTESSSGKLWDFTNKVFTMTPSSGALILNEVSAANQAGLYMNSTDVNSWNGWLDFEATYNDGSYTYTWQYEAYYSSGIRANGVASGGGIAPSANEVAFAVGSHVIDTISGLTNDQAQRVMNALLFGKVSGAGTSVETFRNPSDTKDVCKYNVDTLGNRTLVIVDAS